MANTALIEKAEGMHIQSKVWFSDRSALIPLVEFREARQEDHDDLAAVFTSQSDVSTKDYGEYFLAEVIASQDSSNKALVAQVGDKAVGLLSLSADVDVSILDKCFELET